MGYTVDYDARHDATSLWLVVMPVFMCGFGALMLYDILRETSRRTKQRWRAQGPRRS